MALSFCSVLPLCAALLGCQGTAQPVTEPAGTSAVGGPVAGEPSGKASAAEVAASPSVAPLAKEEDFVGTVGKTEVKRESTPTELVDVRAAQHGGFERMVFEFRERVPGYRVEYIDKPVRDCGEGRTIALAGESWLEVRIYPANAHTEEGQPTIQARERQLGLDVMLEAKQTCDFEAVVTWVLGLSKPNAYRVLELENPPRLVVDVKR